MKIEVLFPEICNLFGDMGNIRYLKKSVPDLEIIETNLNQKPYFVSAFEKGLEMPSMIYMGTLTENGQLLVIKRLKPYCEIIKKCIDNNINFLITGNAFEVFGKAVFEDEKKVSDGIGIFDFVAKRSSRFRYNTFYVGNFNPGNNKEPIKIVGFKCLFGHSYGTVFENGAFNTIVGYGANPETRNEGIRIHNFFATYLIGPFLILNPLFTAWYLKELMRVDKKPAFFDDAIDAYNDRLKEFMEPNRDFHYYKTTKKKYLKG